MDDSERKRYNALELLQNMKKQKICNTFYSNGGSSAPKPSYNHSKASPANKIQNNIINAVCSLISEDRFTVEIPYHQESLDIFKSLPTKRYDAKTKSWSFCSSDHDNLAGKMKRLQPKVYFKPLPNFVLRCMKEVKEENENLDFSHIDQQLYKTLMPFQREGVRFGIEKKGRCMIADDMGLGKTFQALALACYYRSDWPLLVVAPSSVRNNWVDVFYQYVPSVPVMKIQYLTTTRDPIDFCDVLVTSHDMMARCGDTLLAKKFGVFIVDESHTFKNYKAKCTQVAALLAKRAKRTILLSGTPALSRPSELYTQLEMIDPKFFGDFIEYSRRYCAGKTTRFGWDSSGKSHLQELEIILAKRFMIRRTKDAVLPNLPGKRRELVLLDGFGAERSAEDRKLLKSMAQDLATKKSLEKHGALLSFFAETGRTKIPAVCAFLDEILATNVKFLVFAHHRQMMDAVCSLLEERRKSYIRIDGDTSSDCRQRLVERFQQVDNCMCAILSITAANAGITLTAAQLVIFAELHWNPSVLCQAESRAHRIGQMGEVAIKYLLAKGTSDDHVWPMLQVKLNTLSEAGLTEDTFADAVVATAKKTTPQNEDLQVYLDDGVDDHVWPMLQAKLNTLSKTGLTEETFVDAVVATAKKTPPQNGDLQVYLDDGDDDLFANLC